MARQSREDFIREYVLSRAKIAQGELAGESAAITAAKIYDAHLSGVKKVTTEDKSVKGPILLTEKVK